MASLIIFGTFIAFAGVSMVIRNVSEKKRVEALRAAAVQLGLHFAPIDATGLQAGFVGFNLFTQGRSKTIKNIAYGRVDDAEIMLFDYSFVTGHGKSRRTQIQTIAFFQTDQLTLPEFIVRPENIFHKIGQVFGSSDIDLPSYPEFSKRYLLQGPEEAAIRRFFEFGIARYFEANLGLSVEAKLDRFIVYQPGRRLKPEQWPDALNKGRETLATLMNQ